MTQKYLSKKQKQAHRHREQTCGQQGVRGREGWIVIWDQQMQAIIYRMDNKQGSTVDHRKLYSTSCAKP